MAFVLPYRAASISANYGISSADIGLSKIYLYRVYVACYTLIFTILCQRLEYWKKIPVVAQISSWVYSISDLISSLEPDRYAVFGVDVKTDIGK